jgi:hypothetical protein
MQDTLYPLNSKDVEAVARSRANRDIPKNMRYLMYASLIICLAGLYVAYAVHAMYGIGVMIVGCIVLWVYSSFIDKRRKILTKRLKREWQEAEREDKRSG